MGELFGSVIINKLFPLGWAWMGKKVMNTWCSAGLSWGWDWIPFLVQMIKELLQDLSVGSKIRVDYFNHHLI